MVFGAKWGKGVTSFLPLRVLTSVPILVKIDQEMRPESAHRQTQTPTH